MKKLIMILSMGCLIISCKSNQKIVYADKDNPAINATKKYDTTYVQDANGNLRMKLSEIK